MIGLLGSVRVNGVEPYIQNIAKHCGLTTLDESTVDMYPRSLEQKSDFKEFLDKFGQSPKLKSKIFYGVYTKE
jgi:hypothetical protein